MEWADGLRDALVEKMYKVECPKHECIIRQNEIGTAMFIIEDGQFAMFEKNKFIKTLCEKSAFGEGCLLHSTPRSATFQAMENGVVWALDSEHFIKIREKIIQKRDRLISKKVSFLQQIRFLSKFHPNDIEDIADCMKPHLYRRGAHIFQQNEASSQFFFVFSGKCESYKTNPKTNKKRKISAVIILEKRAFY